MSDLRLRRQEAKLARKKIGAHYLKYREEKDNGDLSISDNEKAEDAGVGNWLKEIKEDPYIKESAMIIRDLLTYSAVSATQ